MRDYQTKANLGGAADSITAGKLGAGEANSFLTELKNAVTSAGLTLAVAAGTSETFFQLAQAMAIYGGGGAEYCIDTGAANAYVLTPVSPLKGVPALRDGLTLAFKPGSPNTGAATVNYNATGVVDIRRFNGDALTGGELLTSSKIRYNSSAGWFELVGYVRSSVAVFTASGSYSRPANLISCIVVAVGGGGSGGGAENGTVSETAGGGGGGGGATGIGFFNYADLSASTTVTVGAGATGTTGGGSAGGTSSFGSLVTAGGGGGGELGAAGAVVNYESGGVGGTVGAGDIVFPGGVGGLGQESGNTSGAGGPGGNSMFGGGGAPTRTTTQQNGFSATQGGGGGGGASTGTSSSSAATGGNGGAGIVFIIEFRGEQ